MFSRRYKYIYKQTIPYKAVNNYFGFILLLNSKPVPHFKWLLYNMSILCELDLYLKLKLNDISVLKKKYIP